MSLQFKEGDLVTFRQDLSDEEWDEFKKLCGLIQSREYTQHLMQQTGRFQRVCQVGITAFINFNGDQRWVVPLKFIIQTPVNKQQRVLDKIKQLNARFQLRKLNHA